MGSQRIRLAVVGAHLMGQPLNFELTDRGARLVERATTSGWYRLFALPTSPPKPGLVRSAPGTRGSRSIEVEVWELGVGEFGDFVANVPAPLGIGTIELGDGSWVKGFICEPIGLTDAVEITRFGGWRAYVRAEERVGGEGLTPPLRRTGSTDLQGGDG